MAQKAGIVALGIFLLLGAVMASIAGVTLVFPGTILDRMWALNAPAYARLAPYGKPAGFAFLLLGATLALAAVGWLKRRLWGWWLAVMIIATQMVGDGVNAVMGDLARGIAGFAIAGALLSYLLRPKVRAAFRHEPPLT